MASRRVFDCNSRMTRAIGDVCGSCFNSTLFSLRKPGWTDELGSLSRQMAGRFFLDEIGDLTLIAQAKILRVLQERAIERVGGRKTICVDARIIAATNKDLEEEIKTGNFREDLYYRLKVIHIEMPSLRHIPEDIPVLANHLLDKYCREMKKGPRKLSAGALRCLMNYDWPGNVRELENEIKRIVVLTPREVITEEDLPESIREIPKTLPITFGSERGSPKSRVQSLKETMEELEKRMIEEALQACRQNQLQAAKALGLSRSGLIKKIKRYGIKVG